MFLPALVRMDRVARDATIAIGTSSRRDDRRHTGCAFPRNVEGGRVLNAWPRYPELNMPRLSRTCPGHAGLRHGWVARVIFCPMR